MTTTQELDESLQRLQQMEQRLRELAEEVSRYREELRQKSSPPASLRPPRDPNQPSPLPGLG